MFGGKKIKSKKGREITLLSPAGRGKKYAHEIKTKFRHSNSGNPLRDEDGPIPLTREQIAYRSGYLAARRDNAKAHKYNEAHGKIPKKRTRKAKTE